MFCVSHSPQDGAYRIVSVNEDDARHTDAAVGQRFLKGFRRRVHQLHYFPAEPQSQGAHPCRENEQRGSHGSHKTAQFIMLFCADILGNEHLPRAGKTHGDEGHAVHNVAANGNGGKAYLPQDLPHDNHIRHIVDDLQQVGQEHGHGKGNELPVYVSCCEIRNKGRRMEPHMVPVMHHGGHGFMVFHTASGILLRSCCYNP